MNIIFALAFVATFVAIGVGTALWYAERGREIDADIARFIVSIPPEAFEPDELWAARANKETSRRHQVRPGPAARAAHTPPSGVGGTNVHPLRKDPT